VPCFLVTKAAIEMLVVCDDSSVISSVGAKGRHHHTLSHRHTHTRTKHSSLPSLHLTHPVTTPWSRSKAARTTSILPRPPIFLHTLAVLIRNHSEARPPLRLILYAHPGSAATDLTSHTVIDLEQCSAALCLGTAHAFHRDSWRTRRARQRLPPCTAPFASMKASPRTPGAKPAAKRRFVPTRGWRTARSRTSRTTASRNGSWE